MSSTGTASVSPGSTSATRSAALTRQASNAKKRISVGGGGGVKAANTSGGAGISGSSSSTTTTREHGQGGPRRSMTGNRSDNTVNTSSRMSTSTSNEGSLSNIIDGDDPSVLLESAYADGTPEELSRLTRDQLVSLVVRERQSKEEVNTFYFSEQLKCVYLLTQKQFPLIPSFCHRPSRCKGNYQICQLSLPPQPKQRQTL